MKEWKHEFLTVVHPRQTSLWIESKDHLVIVVHAGVLTEKREDFKEEPNKEPIKEPTEEPIKEPNEEPIKEPTDKPADQQALTRAELQDELGMLFNGITKRMNDEFYYLINQLGSRLDILKRDLEKIIKEEKIIGGKEGVVKK